MKDFRKYDIWKGSHSLCLIIFDVTKRFPKNELYGLTSQMRRSSQSVPTNIAEGCGRSSDKDFKRFLVTALGSLYELDYQTELAKDLKYIINKEFELLQKEIITLRMKFISLIKKINSTQP